MDDHQSSAGEWLGEVAIITVMHNNGVQLTKAARSAPFAFRSWGQSLRAAFAADPECSAGKAGRE